ncbi:pyridoxal-phosphate dependent enzyme, partial [Acinetobacter baumannii]
LTQVDFRLDYVGPGYGVPSEQGESARRWLASTEGIVLDPVYTGKAFAGLLDLVSKGEVSGKVLFWHTGGLPVACAGVRA